MPRIYIKDLHSHIGNEATVSGWVDVRRDHGKIIFLDIRDRSGSIQAVIAPDEGMLLETVAPIRPEWVVELTGEVKKRPEKMVNEALPTGDIELSVRAVRVLGEAKELPFSKDESLNFDTYLDYLPLTLRTKRARAIFTVQAEIIRAFREFYEREEFVEIQAPKLIGEDAEGGASVFEVPYFGHTAHLAQSPQFYKQIMVGVFEKVFMTGNVFRAEKHATTRHLNEYTSLDAEMGFIENHRDVMETLGRMMRHIAGALRARAAEEFAFLGAEFPLLPDDIPSLKLREAQRVIKEKFGEDATHEPDLSPQHERWLSEYAREEFGSDCLFITHFPMEKRPMYTREDPDDPGYARGFDLLFRGLEVVTGGQRVHEYDALVAAMRAKGLDPDRFSFYLQAFKYGMPPHGGFGMGLERLTARFLGLENVKEATLFPREINRIDARLSE